MIDNSKPLRIQLQDAIKKYNLYSLLVIFLIAFLYAQGMNYLLDNMPDFSTNLNQVNHMIIDSSWEHFLKVFFWIVIFAPIMEEIIFRGFLWKLIEWPLTKIIKSKSYKELIPGLIAWCITSSLFALAHMEPIHILGVLPLAFILGYFRYKTGSILSTIAIHMANNFAVVCVLKLIGTAL